MGGNAEVAAQGSVEQDLPLAHIQRGLGSFHPEKSFFTSTACLKASQIMEPPLCFRYLKRCHLQISLSAPGVFELHSKSENQAGETGDPPEEQRSGTSSSPHSNHLKSLMPAHDYPQPHGFTVENNMQPLSTDLS